MFLLGLDFLRVNVDTPRAFCIDDKTKGLQKEGFVSIRNEGIYKSMGRLWRVRSAEKGLDGLLLRGGIAMKE